MNKTMSIYSVIRIVPNPDDGQFRNVGIILVSTNFPHIQIRVEKDYSKLRFICKDFDSKIYNDLIDNLIGKFRSMYNQRNLNRMQSYMDMYHDFIKSDCEHIQFSDTLFIASDPMEKEMDLAYSTHIGVWDV